MLELESGSNDPMAYMLTIVLIQVIGSGSNFDIVIILKDLFLQFLFGGVLGYAFGKFSVWLINKIELSNSSLYPILLLSIIYFHTDRLGERKRISGRIHCRNDCGECPPCLPEGNEYVHERTDVAVPDYHVPHAGTLG